MKLRKWEECFGNRRLIQGNSRCFFSILITSSLCSEMLSPKQIDCVNCSYTQQRRFRQGP